MCVFSCLTVKTSPEHILAYSNTLSPFSDVRIVQNLWLTELYKQIKKIQTRSLFDESCLKRAYELSKSPCPVSMLS